MPFLEEAVKRNMQTPQDKRVPKTNRSILIVVRLVLWGRLI
jgi:hypothetical protein